MKEQLLVEMKDSYEDALYVQALHLYLPMIMQHPFYGPGEQYKQLKAINFAALNEFRNDFFKDIHYSLFFAGNINKEQALLYVDNFKDSLH